MATEKTIKTRLLLKQDTLANWNASSLALKKGEVVFATTAAATTSGGVEPVVVAKVCTEDGLTFSDLPYSFYAKASDVYDWAKKENIEFTKSGTGNVVSGLSFVNGKIQYTTASVATSEGLEALQNTVNDIETEIADSKATWAKDTTYTYALANGKLKITDNLTSIETVLDIVVPEELSAAIELARLSVASGDKVLAIADDVISSTINLTYDSANKKIKLLGIADAVIAEVDATDFIKDGMVDNVSFDASTKTLTITFNTASGKEAIDVDLTSLVDTYTAGNGIAISNNIVSLKVDSASESFLSVSSSGVKLAGVQSAINTAASGALADAKSYADGLAPNYATAAQGIKADSALQEVEVGTGLAVTAKSANGQIISIDDSCTFILDCGNATV